MVLLFTLLASHSGSYSSKNDDEDDDEDDERYTDANSTNDREDNQYCLYDGLLIALALVSFKGKLAIALFTLLCVARTALAV